MSRAPPRIKPVSEKKREREVLQYVAAYRDLPPLDELGPVPETCYLPVAHNPRPSTDSTLTALAQLAALRLGAQRALISLVDDKRQYVLAEATPRLPLRDSLADRESNPLWLGSISIPRTWGVCEQVLGLDQVKLAAGQGAPVIINNDLTESERHAQRSYVRDGPRVRFYAGAALVSPNGAIVGAICVFDEKPRPDGMSEEDVTYLVDLSATIVNYLGTYTVKDRFMRGEKLTRGLISFAEGASALIPLNSIDQLDSAEPHSPTSSATMSSEHGLQSIHDPVETNHAPSQTASQGSSEHQSLQSHPQPSKFSTGSDTVRAGSTRNTSLRALQDTILPMNSRSMFARAANVMLASSDLDGVLILDASVAATGHRQHPAAPERGHHGGGFSDPESGEGGRSKSESSEDSSSREGANKNANSSSSKRCQILGAAPSGRPLVNADGTPGFGSFSESSLARLLRECPHGKVFNYTATGLSMSSTDDSSSNRSAHDQHAEDREGRPAESKHRQTRTSRSSKAITELLTGARSVAFVPFWDYERSRWFAGCLCWTNDPDRLLSSSVDLAYFNIFSHSIMRELSRLDAMALNQQKTTFVASISHELRSPLHGILGTLEFIKDTPLDTFQTSMLNSLNACGQTLLDTINHVMDHSKMSITTKNVSSRRLKNTKTVRLSSKPLKTRRLRDPAFDLCIATEEVVEAVFAGSSFIPIMSSKNAPVSPTESTSTSTRTDISDPTTKRKTIYVVLDIASEKDWVYCFPVGSWKRTVMNIFGNAIKYTTTGYITVSLQATDVARSTGSATTVTLTVTDTGAGMSPAFLANKAFQPFSQENPHSTGVGLGLSIVRQIIETNGGKIEVSSDHSSGTKLTVKLSLIKPDTSQIALPQRTEYLSWLPRLEGRRVCILHNNYESTPELLDGPQNVEGFARFTDALTTTLQNHLKMKVIQTSKWEGNDADIVICPEPSFEYLASIRHQRADSGAKRAAVTIFCALDALEAATLRSDVRVKDRESVVEIISQPLGPYKLAYVLNKCLDRFEHPDENVQPVQSPTPSVKPNSTQSTLNPPSQAVLSPSPSQAALPPSPPQAALSPPLPLPPLFNQPHWSESDLPQTLSHSPEDSSNDSTPVAGTPHPEGRALPRLTIPTRSISRSSNVLITDDNLINRKLLIAFMKKHNFQYSEADNGLEALRAYQEAQMQYNVILMDMSMPVMDGMSATRAIRQYEQEYNVPRCCIIALTGLASASAKLEAWNSGIDHFMTKPVNFKALETFLRKEEARREEVAANA